MKKIYNSPELEIVKFTILEAIAAGGFNGGQFSQNDGDIIATDGSEEEFGWN